MKIIHTKPIFSIFSQAKLPAKPEDKQEILIDYREKNSMVASELISLGFKIEFRELKIGDYLVNNIAIERKTVSDFLSSMVNKRLVRQLEELQQYETKLLIIEGTEEQELYSDSREGIHSNSIRGFLLSILFKYKVPVVFSKNSEDTARFIELIARKKTRVSSLNVKKHTFNKKERMQFILEGFPGIGPTTAKKLLSHFKSLKNVLAAPVEELEKIIGKKSAIFKIIDEEY